MVRVQILLLNGQPIEQLDSYQGKSTVMSDEEDPKMKPILIDDLHNLTDWANGDPRFITLSICFVPVVRNTVCKPFSA